MDVENTNSKHFENCVEDVREEEDEKGYRRVGKRCSGLSDCGSNDSCIILWMECV
jgi:hypothetical protein